MREPKLPAIFCPHCDTRARARSSEQTLPTTREVRMLCQNEDCAHVFIVEITVVRTIAPSMMPKPGIFIPGGNQDRRRTPQPGNDNHPPPANDDAERPGAACSDMT